jgi:leucyl-tRNA synthetase
VDSYDFKALEARWKPVWEKAGTYRTGSDPSREPFYCLDFFPYPSGAGLSVGHCRNYIPTDVISRKKRMCGANVLHPMGWDAFGQPAEEYAIKTGIHPSIVTRRNTDTYRRQMRLIEASYDWTREIDSSSPDYYRWTQFFFILLFDRGLAYEDESEQMWCPSCRIVLSNEEAAGGVCWRCSAEVTRKRLKQWFFRITAYADRLNDDLDRLDWPESIKAMQRNWIGRSEGAEVHFVVESPSGEAIPLPVYTTRLDTIYGATFCVVSPEHPRIEDLVQPGRLEEVRRYVAAARSRSDRDRMVSGEREKTGVFTGSFAVNPYDGSRVPLWVADYVLAGYGTAAIMAVPAHDERDHAFASRHGIPIVEVVAPGGVPRGVEAAAVVADGILINSGEFSGLESGEARARMVGRAEREGFGRAVVRYRLRDWLVSRQRYWGAPVPVIHCPVCGAVPDRNLPVLLPEVDRYEPDDTGRSPLARAEAWVATSCPSCGGPASRDTNTMAGFACSSWYFLRFASPFEKDRPFDPEAVKYWLPVDLYVGGAEHAVMHLLYARFWTKVMADAGMLDFTEPFTVLKNQGMLLGHDHQKMSKSKGNVVTPDEMSERYGVDALRLYILFMGPFEADLEWSEEGIAGTYRFLKRLWSLVLDSPPSVDLGGGEVPTADPAAVRELRYQTAKTVKKVTQDVDSFQFNTAVASLMEMANFLSANRALSQTAPGEWRRSIGDMLVLLAPMTPFVTEELWLRAGLGAGSIHSAGWPAWDDADLVRDEVEIAVQIAGRVRAHVMVPSGSSEDVMRASALGHERIRELLSGREPRKVIVVPGRLVNIIP